MTDTKRAQAWLLQAEDDLKWGKDSLQSEYFAQTCFIAQQVGEKALKALAFYRRYDLVKTHSILKIAQELKINSEIENAGRKLDLYYISSRYPDALPDHGVPSQAFGREQAEEALALAALILDSSCPPGQEPTTRIRIC